MVLPGNTGFAEFAFIDGQKINRARLLGAFDRDDTDHACGLRHRFNHHHARIDRTVREMARKHGFIERDVLDADAAEIAPDIDNPIDQQHRGSDAAAC